MMYEKYRTTYELEDVEVALDEMPTGDFLEIGDRMGKAFKGRLTSLGWIGRPASWIVIPCYSNAPEHYSGLLFVI